MRPRYWAVVAVALAATAVVLPMSRATRTVIGEAQIIYALTLAALLVRLVWTTLRSSTAQ